MGAAYFIVLENEIDGLDAMIDGKSLAKSAKVLDSLALQLGVRPISEFISIDPVQAAELMEDEGMDVDSAKLPPLKQFSAQDGLATISALMSRPEAQPAMHDLKNCERILTIAAKQGVGWHFEVDY
jgi:hypothetical protein